MLMPDMPAPTMTTSYTSQLAVDMPLFVGRDLSNIILKADLCRPEYHKSQNLSFNTGGMDKILRGAEQYLERRGLLFTRPSPEPIKTLPMFPDEY